MKKLIGGVIVVLVVAVVILTLVGNDDASHYDYDWDKYEEMNIKVKTVDAFVIKVDPNTIVIVSILNRGERDEGLISQTVVEREGAWIPYYPSVMKIVPRVYSSNWILGDEEVRSITDVIGNESYSGRGSIILRSADVIGVVGAISKTP